MFVGENRYYCPSCDTIKALSEFGIKKSGDFAGKPQGYCKECAHKKRSEWESANRKHATAESAKRNQRRRAKLVAAGLDKLHTNKKCSLYLNRIVAEEALARYFKYVDRMRGKGFNFICDKQYKVAVKSSCQHVNPVTGATNWTFNIKKNKVADYILCLTFDNRTNLNPQKIWLIPTEEVSNQDTIFVTCDSKKAYDRMNSYEKPIRKMEKICNQLKEKNLI